MKLFATAMAIDDCNNMVTISEFTFYTKGFVLVHSIVIFINV